MKNVIIAGAYPKDPNHIRGGVEAHVYGLAAQLKRQPGIASVRVFALPAKAAISATSAMQSEGMEVVRLGSWHFLALGIFHLPRILKAVRAAQNPLVHVHGTGLLQAALIVCLRVMHIPHVFTLHGITEKETMQRYDADKTITNFLRAIFYMLLERLTLTVAEKVIVDTEYVRQEIIRKDRMEVIPNGVFLDEFAEAKNSLRTAGIILSVGVFVPRKGHHLLLRAFAKVAEAFSDAKLIIAGAVTQPDYLSELKQLAFELGVSQQVEFLADADRKAILKAYGRARIFALHSEEESQCTAICEAFAAGLPVAATKIGGIPYVAKDRENALLVSYGDVDTFARVIIALLSDAPLYTKIANGAAASSKRFDWNTIINDIMRYYNA